MLNGLFAKLRGYGELSAEQQELLSQACGEPVAVSKGMDLVVQGTSPSASCLLLEGLAGRYKMSRDGDRQITALHVAGDFVDIHSLLKRPLDDSVGCLTDCKVAYFSHARLRELIEPDFGLAAMLWHNTLVDGAISREWLVGMGLLQAEPHTAHLLCEMYLRLERVGLATELTFQLPLSQGELADVLGLSVVHMNRTVQSLRASELVVWKGATVDIPDWDRLADFAEFDPAYLGWGPNLRPD